jgi:hypothetical protein
VKHWGKELVKWAQRELPAVITELGQEGPDRVFDVLAERYREWLKVHGARLGAAPTGPQEEEQQEEVPNSATAGPGAKDEPANDPKGPKGGGGSKGNKRQRRRSGK